MRLVHRISAFFLTALAIALAGNAILLCGLAHFLLHQRFEEQLQSALNTLVAAVEVEVDEVKWEPSDHTIAIGADEAGDDVRWAVFNEDGLLVDHSENLSPHRPVEQQLLATVRNGDHVFGPRGRVHGWTCLRRELAAPHPEQATDRGPADFDSLEVVVLGRPTGVWEMTTGLAGLVIAVSITVWVIAAVAGIWYCRRALQPVQVMAQQAREVKNADFQMRWPTDNQDEELAELSAAFNMLLDRQQQAFEQQRQFTGNAAHQLRTPLTVLLGQIDVVLRRPRTEAEYRETLQVLRDQTQELQGIVESLLFLARLEGDAPFPDVSSQRLDLFLQHYRETWSEHPRFGDIAIHTAPNLFLTTSWPLLKQLLDNLVSNALKYSDAGSPVVVTAANNESCVSLVVSDEGIGISGKDREALFRPFFRSENARRSGIGGVGLGLAIATQIAKALGGELHYESGATRGSRFMLTISLNRHSSEMSTTAHEECAVISCEKESLLS